MQRISPSHLSPLARTNAVPSHLLSQFQPWIWYRRVMETSFSRYRSYPEISSMSYYRRNCSSKYSPGSLSSIRTSIYVSRKWDYGPSRRLALLANDGWDALKGFESWSNSAGLVDSIFKGVLSYLLHTGVKILANTCFRWPTLAGSKFVSVPKASTDAPVSHRLHEWLVRYQHQFVRSS